jgi:hypothetical protein
VIPGAGSGPPPGEDTSGGPPPGEEPGGGSAKTTFTLRGSVTHAPR